jgi:hypothetical protein
MEARVAEVGDLWAKLAPCSLGGAMAQLQTLVRSS